MACCFGAKSSGKVKSEIDKQLETQAVLNKLKFKILLLGSGESGKSTVLKGLKIIHKIDMTDAELLEYVHSLRRNAVQCMNILIEQANIFEYEFDEVLKSKTKVLAALDADSETHFTMEIADSIRELWKSEPIKNTWERNKEFWILDAAEYYFENVERFAQEEFRPTEEDCVMARVMTTGIITTEIQQPPLTFTVVDVGGQRTERRKWIHCFDDCTAIIFVVNLSGYNTVLFEDQSQNRMAECISLFKQTVNNPIFATTPIFLLLNKKDLFEAKIRAEGIKNSEVFSDYEGTGDIMDSLKFIEAKFRSQIQSGSPDRLTVFHMAARFKKDIKVIWEDIVTYIKTKYKKEIDAALKVLGKDAVAGIGEEGNNPPQTT